MRLPVIKHIVSFIEKNDEDYVAETMETLEDLIDLDSLKDEELDVIGELLSNLSGALEVYDACLLYTSPSPRDMRRSRMPSSA